MKKTRVYIDTSVIGGSFDEEFAQESLALFDMARQGRIVLLVSDLLVAEIRRAPQEVIDLFTALPTECLERINSSPESAQLRDKYIEADVVAEGSIDDAHHVALATVSRADMIVSWNFRHIVHYEKIRGFNSVNLRHGYSMIDIWSPREVV